MNEYHQIITAKRFVDHRSVCLTPQTVVELAFHQVE
jgi:hypothetical protein